MLTLSQAYGSRWSAAFGQRDLRYNDRIWKPVGEHHEPEDMFIGLMDPTDGSNFTLRIEAVQALADLSNEDIENSMAEGIADERFQARYLDSWIHEIAGVPFQFVEYGITNPKFGEQVLCHAYARGDSEATLLSMAWPAALPRGADRFPVKFSVLLEGVAF
jgi:hypothetical protein